MNDTPGWASPGSSPSDERKPSQAAERPGPAQTHPTAPESPQAVQPTHPGVPAQSAQDEPPRQDAAGGPARPEGTSPAAGAGDKAPPAADPVSDSSTAAAEDAAPAAEPEPTPGAPAGSPSTKWSKTQPPPGRWSAPEGGAAGAGRPSSAANDRGRSWAGPSGGRGPGGTGWGSPGGPRTPDGPHAPGGQGPGWGGQPGTGWGGWQGRPPAAKPGVIPLRPLGIGEILDGAVSTMRTHWRTVLGISLAVAVVTEILLTLLERLVFQDFGDTGALTDMNASMDELAHALGDASVILGVNLVVTLLGTLVATALLTSVTSRAVLGRPVTLAQAWQDARPQLGRLFVLTFLLPLIVVAVAVVPALLIASAGGDTASGPAVLVGLVCGIVALWLAIRLSLASPALMLEKQTVGKALSRSTKLVKGAWWRVFGVQVLSRIIVYIVSSIILLPFTVIASAAGGNGVASGLIDTGGGDWTYLVIIGIGSVIGTTLTLPLTAGVAVLLYIDQRIRREALDLELGRAAGLQGYGSEASGSDGS